MNNFLKSLKTNTLMRAVVGLILGVLFAILYNLTYSYPEISNVIYYVMLACFVYPIIIGLKMIVYAWIINPIKAIKNKRKK